MAELDLPPGSTRAACPELDSVGTMQAQAIFPAQELPTFPMVCRAGDPRAVQTSFYYVWAASVGRPGQYGCPWNCSSYLFYQLEIFPAGRPYDVFPVPLSGILLEEIKFSQ